MLFRNSLAPKFLSHSKLHLEGELNFSIWFSPLESKNILDALDGAPRAGRFWMIGSKLEHAARCLSIDIIQYHDSIELKFLEKIKGPPN